MSLCLGLVLVGLVLVGLGQVIFLIQIHFSIIVGFILIIIFLRLDKKLCFHENRNVH